MHTKPWKMLIVVAAVSCLLAYVSIFSISIHWQRVSLSPAASPSAAGNTIWVGYFSSDDDRNAWLFVLFFPCHFWYGSNDHILSEALESGESALPSNQRTFIVVQPHIITKHGVRLNGK